MNECDVADVPRYLPQGDYVPFGWPQGTGVEFLRTPDTPENRMAIAEVLSRFGCHPRKALMAADTILDEGCYAARLGTATAICANLREDLAEIGILMRIETVVPKENNNHAMSPHLAGKETRSSRYPGTDLVALLEAAAEELSVEVAALAPRFTL